MEDTKEKLELPEYIKSLLFIPNIKSSDIENDAIIKETYRIFNVLYYEMSYAKYTLEQGIDTENQNNSIDCLWRKLLFCNTSILWYNNCFDVLCQTVWLRYQIYRTIEEKDGRKTFEKLTTKNIDRILAACKLRQIPNELEIKGNLEAFYNKYIHIRELANKLKHKNGIRYDIQEQDYPNINNEYKYVNGEIVEKNNKKHTYNSKKTLKIEIIDMVIKELTLYHIDFLKLIKEVCISFKDTQIYSHMSEHGLVPHPLLTYGTKYQL